MGDNEVQEFLTYLASERKVSASTQNQALSGLIFLYRNGLHKELDLPTRLITARRSPHLLTILTLTYVRNVLQYVGDTVGLIAGCYIAMVIINAQEANKAVPNSLRQAGLGLGAIKWQTIGHHVLQGAMSGILAGTILAISCAIGETDQLMVVGAST